MRLILRSGSVDTRGQTSTSSSPEDGFSDQPSLTASSSSSSTGTRRLLHGQLSDVSGRHSDVSGRNSDSTDSSSLEPRAPSCSSKPSKRRRSAAVCAALLVACVAAMILQATEPSICIGWNEKPGVASAVEEKLSSLLVGQDLARDMILSEIRRFVAKADEKRTKPLVLVFYGPSGTGKSYAAEIVGRGLMSSAEGGSIGGSKRYIVPDNQQEAPAAGRGMLVAKLLEDARLCARSNVFLLENVDLARKASWLGELAPLLSGRPYVRDGHSYSFGNAVFILTARTAADELLRHTQGLRAAGADRADPSLGGVLGALLEQRSASVEHVRPIADSVDAFVPFLPLERSHVLRCVLTEMRKINQDATDEAVRHALSLAGFPADDDGDEAGGSVLFSEYGCKKVPLYVALVPAE